MNHNRYRKEDFFLWAKDISDEDGNSRNIIKISKRKNLLFGRKINLKLYTFWREKFSKLPPY